MSGAIVAFETQNGDAGEELEALGDEYIVDFLRYLQKITAKSIDHWKLQEFWNYLGVPIYKGQIDDRVLIFAVEEETDGGRKVTILYAGRVEADSSVRTLIAARAGQWFSASRIRQAAQDGPGS